MPIATRLTFDCRHVYASGFTLDARFECGAGVTALSGPSGAGKTTVLHLIAGLLRPRSGRIALGDCVLLDTESNVCVPVERRRVGMVFQDHLLFPHLSVRSNLRYGIRRPPVGPIDFHSVVEVLELGELLDRSPRQLSGGERQRVALGRAILPGPELLLMDEPVASLDSDLKSRILDYLIKAVHAWKIPTLFVSHDATDRQRLAEQVVALQRGKVAAS